MFRLNLLLLFPLAVHGFLDVHIQESKKDEIPSPQDAACMARYVVHNSNWGSLAYISQKNQSTRGTALSRVYSVSDGTAENSTGVVYLMVSPLDLTIVDLSEKNNCSFIASLAETNYCTAKHYDAQDPRCAQAILNGYFVKIPQNNDEYKFAKAVLWDRHPIMKFWFYAVPGHKWFFAKIVIRHIEVVDAFGGRKFPSVGDYFHKKCDVKQISANKI